MLICDIWHPDFSDKEVSPMEPDGTDGTALKQGGTGPCSRSCSHAIRRASSPEGILGSLGIVGYIRSSLLATLRWASLKRCARRGGATRSETMPSLRRNEMQGLRAPRVLRARRARRARRALRVLRALQSMRPLQVAVPPPPPPGLWETSLRSGLLSSARLLSVRLAGSSPGKHAVDRTVSLQVAQTYV